MPRPTLLIVTAAATLLAGAAALAWQTTPPGHPPILPPDHPEVSKSPRPQAPSGETPAADPADVKSVEAIVSAFYASISGPKGEPRDWDRFRSLFMGGARLMTTREAGGGIVPVVLAPEDYMMANNAYYEGGGYYEQELYHRADTFGRIAHVFSTYASRRKLEDSEPYSRGVNSFQLMFDGQRWWIASMAWDHERPGDNPLRPEHLPEG